MRKQFLKIALFLILTVSGAVGSAQQIALLKYRGGGDWYANPTSLPNLIAFCNQNLSMSLDPKPATVEVGSTDLFQYPFVHMTGHGNVVFSQEEAQNLRMYLLSGGFLHIDDNYGLNNFIRTQMKLVFPELDFVELPYSHPSIFTIRGVEVVMVKVTLRPCLTFSPGRGSCFTTVPSGLLSSKIFTLLTSKVKSSAELRKSAYRFPT